jgi:uncharacterized protein DUF1203
MPSFQLVGLPAERFASLFELSDAELSRIDARRVIADSKPGFPCRVSLRDAEIGEELLLLPFEHQPAASPYRASGPIFVRKVAAQAAMEPGVVPDYVRTRLMSVRLYDAAHQMIDATVCAGIEAGRIIESMFSRADAGYIHLHNANRGCFSCEVRRLDSKET